jgi:hypothetical protein
MGDIAGTALYFVLFFGSEAAIFWSFYKEGKFRVTKDEKEAVSRKIEEILKSGMNDNIIDIAYSMKDLAGSVRYAPMKHILETVSAIGIQADEDGPYLKKENG